MRQIAFIKNPGKILKVMIYEYPDGVYLFGYDCLNDTSCVWDLHYDSVEESLEYCNEAFGITGEDWIIISNPEPDCLHDFILPTKKADSKSAYQYQSFISGRWVENFIANTKENGFGGLTGNERLFITGLINELDQANINDKPKAQKILTVLGIG
ncbi:hypothetical protein [Mucilaginibacter sp.]